MSGRTTPLSTAAQTTMADALEPAVRSHPWPPTIPSGRFGHRPSEPIAYTQVKPRVVVELDVDTAFEQHRWRHACRFVRVRRDLRVADLASALVDP